MLISPNGVINVKAADIETGKQQSANSSSDKIDKEKEGKNNYEKNMKNSVETRNLYIIGDSYAHFTKWSN